MGLLLVVIFALAYVTADAPAWVRWPYYVLSVIAIAAATNSRRARRRR